MKVGSFRIRMGVIDHQKKSIGWINELQRSTILTARSASCSFYVPMLIPIVVALTQDCSSVESEKENASNNTDQRVLLSIIAGSVEFNEIINVNDSTFRLYGSRISTTGFKGSEFALVASEEIVEITICDVATEKVLASFEYKHLYSDDIPQGMDVDAIDYDGSSIPFNTISLEGKNASTAPSPSVKLNEAVEVDELIDSDVEIIMGDGRGDSTPKKAAEGQRRLVIPSLYPRVFPKQPESPSLDPGRLGGLLGRSFQPLLKPMHRCREPKLKVKAETSGEEGSLPSGGKTVSPPHYIRKDTVAKVDDIQARIKNLEAATEELGVVYQKKVEKARAACARAEQRAEDECNLTRRKNLEEIETLKEKLSIEMRKLQWLREQIKTEVITISDDESEMEADVDMSITTRAPPSEFRSLSTM